MYREVCDQHLPWEQKVPETVTKQGKKFERSLPDQVQVPRSLPGFKETIEAIDLRAFRDTGGAGTAAAVDAVAYQASGVNQGLLAAKSRLVKKGLTIPRLELVSAHMAANLEENVKKALEPNQTYETKLTKPNLRKRSLPPLWRPSTTLMKF